MKISGFDRLSADVTLYLAVILTSFFAAFILAKTSMVITIAVVAGLTVCITCFIKPEAALYFLIFAMLLSPEFGQRSAGGTGGSGVTIRLDDFLLLLIGLSWLARMAIFKNVGVITYTRLNAPIFFYLTACILSTVIGMYIGNVKPLRGFFYVLKYFEYFVVYFILVNHLQTEKQARNLVIALLCTCLVINIIGILQIPSGHRVSAPFEGKNGEPNTLGGYLVIMMALSMSLAVHVKPFKAVLPLWCISALSFVTLMFTRSRGSYLAFVAMYLSLVFISKKKTLIGILIFAVFAGPYLAPKAVVERISYTFNQRHHRDQKKVGDLTIDTSTSARLQGWSDGFEAFTKRPLTGYGVTGFGFLDAQYLVVLVETGLIGIFSFLFLLGSLLKEGLINYSRVTSDLNKGICLGFLACLCGMIVHAVSANTFIIVRVMEPFWFFAGLMALTPKIEKNKPEELLETPVKTIKPKFTLPQIEH